MRRLIIRTKPTVNLQFGPDTTPGMKVLRKVTMVTTFPNMIFTHLFEEGIVKWRQPKPFDQSQLIRQGTETKNETCLPFAKSFVSRE